MTGRVSALHARAVALASGCVLEGVALLVGRLALANVFWRSGRTKVVEGSWLEVSDTTRYLFAEEYAGVPLPAELGATLATYAEFFLPLLLVIGLGTRVSAAGLLAMTAVIQVFVYPDAWQTHLLWTGIGLVLVARGGGVFSIDALVKRFSAG